MKKRLAVVIPIYQKKLNSEEKKSVEICRDKLAGRYDLYFIAPTSLCLDDYSEFVEIKVKRFPNKFFKNTDTYNKLMLYTGFYKEFAEYEYMLIAQTDTLILDQGNEIERFMDAGYDYWGAPWEEKQEFWFYTTKGILYEKFHIGKKFLLRVGNGGFSLRNISKTIHLLKEKWFWRILWHGNEDFFFSCYGLDNKCGFKVAPVELARQFALETDMRESLEAGLKPYAVHKWQVEYQNFTDIERYVKR